MPLPNGQWTDFVSDYMAYTEHELTTDLHRRWAAISCVAGALERRVWVRAGDHIAFPNLYVLLVAPPGVGKYIIETTRDLWNETIEPGTTDKPAFSLAPDSVSSASLIDDLARAKQSRIVESGPPYVYHSLLIASEEFEVLLPSYDPIVISRLNSLFNNKPLHRETRRHGPARDVTITNPQLNILAGATPAYFTAHFPEEAWATGLIRRIIMVFQAEAPIKDLFATTPDRSILRAHLLARLGQIASMYGEATWDSDAFHYMRDWHLAGRPPEPRHSKLVHYNRSRSLLVLKLALVSGISRTGQLVIAHLDVERAMQWLFEVERLMPDIFREMVGKSDSSVIEEMHYYAQSLWVKNKQKPITTDSLIQFLAHRLPSEKVPRVLEVAEAMNVIARVAGTQDLWVPRPKHLHGME